MQQIKTLDDLHQASINKKAVVVPKHGAWRKPMPAAVLLCQQAYYVRHLFQLGMYIYEKKT